MAIADQLAELGELGLELVGQLGLGRLGALPEVELDQRLEAEIGILEALLDRLAVLVEAPRAARRLFPEAGSRDAVGAEDTAADVAHQAQLAVDGVQAQLQLGPDLGVLVALADDAVVEAFEALAAVGHAALEELEVGPDVGRGLAFLEQRRDEGAVAAGDRLQVGVEAGLEVAGEVDSEGGHL